jgi:hypothetical protein
MNGRFGFGFALLFTAACGADTFTHPDAAPPGDDGGNNPVNGGATDGGTVDAIPPAGCDGSKLPTQDVCVVNDAAGVFVSASLGTATGDGSRAHPMASLTAGIAAAKKAKRRVYACAETYAEQVQLAEGVHVFGYFACNAGWTIGAAHAVVKAPASPAVTATNIGMPTRIEAVDMVSPDFADKAQTSIALLASGSPGLTITHATLHAGTGGKGDDGTNGIQLTASTTKAGTSTSADGVTGTQFIANVHNYGKTGGTNVCSGETGHDGGPGGNGGYGGVFQSQYFASSWIWNTVAQSTTGGSPAIPTTQTAQGGAQGGYGGSSGAAGASGMDGAQGANGTFTASGYVPLDGTAGTNGSPGQGGGGSGGFAMTYTDYNPGSWQNDYAWGEPGAGGGAGGCPGLAGTQGKGGGASIAVLAVASALTFDAVTIESSAGGAGGNAGLASVPTSGGSGGYGAVHTTGAGGGGAGGLAGVSGNGAGGPSIAIAYQGSKPQLLASTLTPGAGGSGVAQRLGPDGKTIPASSAGSSEATYSF